MTDVVLVALLGSFLGSWLLTLLVRRWARAVGFVDRPTQRKAHSEPIALGGGIALFLSVCGPILGGTFAAWLLQDRPVPAWVPALAAQHLEGIASKFPSVSAIVGGALVLHVLGLWDDRRALGPWSKLLVQVLVAWWIAGPVGIRAAEALPSPLPLVLTVVWIVAITNAFNFLDNMDGLSAGVAAVAAGIFALASGMAGQIFVPVMGCVIVGACAGFLCFNFSPASIFMGDAGSLVIGYLMAVLTILTTYYDPAQGLTPVGVLMPILVLAVPLYDMLSVVIHRARARVSPFTADRRHFSHRLVMRGMSRRGAVLTIYLATASTALPAVLLPQLEDWRLALPVLFQCACVVAMIAILEHPPANHSA